MSPPAQLLSVAPLRRDAPASPRWDLSPAGDLVLRLVRSIRTGDEGSSFLSRRTLTELDGPTGPEGRYLDAVVEAGVERDRVVDALVSWAGYLEGRNQLAGASRILDEALRWDGGSPELALHAGRVARKTGDRDRAAELYRRTLSSGRSGGRLTRMAHVGMALLAPEPERALGRVLRRALDDGDAEVAGVVHEERARLRRRKGDRHGALRDYGASCLRYPEASDRGRVAHAAADLLVAAGDPLAAREVLLEIGAIGLPSQWDLARSRLLGIARSTGDDLGLRRWKGEARSGLVSLAPSRSADGESSLRPLVSRWIGRVRRVVERAG